LTGAALFVVGVGMVLIGIVLVIRGKRRAPVRRRF
jgi:hypothetical protein